MGSHVAFTNAWSLLKELWGVTFHIYLQWFTMVNFFGKQRGGLALVEYYQRTGKTKPIGVLLVFRALRRSVVVSLGRDLFIQWQGPPSRNGLALSANNWHICRGQTFNNITWTQHGLQVAWGGCMVWMCRKTTSLSWGGRLSPHGTASVWLWAPVPSPLPMSWSLTLCGWWQNAE